MFLEQDEIEQLTGYKLGKKQVSWLSKSGIKFTVNRYGHPLVLKKHIETLLGAESTKSSRVEPDVRALKNKLGLT